MSRARSPGVPPCRPTRTAGHGLADSPDSPAPARLHVVGPDEAYPDWEAIYRDNVGRIYRLMFTKVGNRADAEDLTAEVFVTALRPLRVSASIGEVRAYLLATARTVLAGYWRRTLGREVTTVEQKEIPEVFTEAPHNALALTRAQEILGELPDRYRRILELRFLGSCSVKEAAAELGVSVANAKVLQHRALRLAAEKGT